MRKNLRVAMAFFVLGSAGTSFAQSSVTIYGVLDASVEYSKSGSASLSRMNSSAFSQSRLGFRGVEDLGNGWSAVFRLESGLNSDNGTFAQGGAAFGRESSVGFSSKTWGTFNVGRLPHPYYQNQYRMDAFLNTMAGGSAAITRSTATATTQLLPLYITARENNSFRYDAPQWNNFELSVLASLGEGSAAIGPSFVGMAGYSRAPVDFVAIYGRQKSGSGGTGSIDAYAIGGSVDLSVAKIYAGITSESNDCTTCAGVFAKPPGVAATGTSEFRLINLGARIPLGAWTGIVQAARVQDRSQYAVSTGSQDAMWFAVGGQYSLSKRTTIYATLGTISNQNGSQYALGTGSAQLPAGSVGAGNPRSSVIAAGFAHRF